MKTFDDITRKALKKLFAGTDSEIDSMINEMEKIVFADTNKEPTWLKFERFDLPGRKTPIYQVTNKESGVYLGDIKWHGAWRKYTFFTKPSSQVGVQFLFEATCLQDMTNFLNQLMIEHKAAKSNEKKERATH